MSGDDTVAASLDVDMLGIPGRERGTCCLGTALSFFLSNLGTESAILRRVLRYHGNRALWVGLMYISREFQGHVFSDVGFVLSINDSHAEQFATGLVRNTVSLTSGQGVNVLRKQVECLDDGQGHVVLQGSVVNFKHAHLFRAVSNCAL